MLQGAKISDPMKQRSRSAWESSVIRPGKVLTVSILFAGLTTFLFAQPSLIIDLDKVEPDSRKGALTRIYGSKGVGSFGLPVACGGDMDGDGYLDYAMASFLANPFDRISAGEVFLVFGKGTIGETVDTGKLQARVLRIAGDVIQETAGNEIWMDDVTGDGLADLLIGRQNYSPSTSRVGAGALSIVVGGPELRSFAARLEPLDLRQPHPSVRVFTLLGHDTLDRLGIWMRTGDVDGDGTADFVVGADQEDSEEAKNSGAIYLIRGGPHLNASLVVDLAGLAGSALEGHIRRFPRGIHLPDSGFGR